MRSFLRPKYEIHDVNGERLNFYPVSVHLLTRLKGVGEPLIRMMSRIQENLINRKSFADQEYKETNDGDFKQVVSSIKAMSPEMVDKRKEELEATVRDIVETSFNRDTPRLLVEICMDSLREIFTKDARGAVDSEELDAVHSEMDLSTLVQMLIGVAKANQKGLGPFGEKILRIFQKPDPPEPKTQNQEKLNANLSSNEPDNSQKSTLETNEEKSQQETIPTPRTLLKKVKIEE